MHVNTLKTKMIDTVAVSSLLGGGVDIGGKQSFPQMLIQNLAKCDITLKVKTSVMSYVLPCCHLHKEINQVGSD